MGNTKIALIGGIVAAVAVLGGFLLWVNSGRLQKQNLPTQEPTFEREVFETISAEELGLRLIPRSDKRAVTMEMTNLTGIQTVEYELSYLAKGDIPRGVIGTIEVKSSDKKISRELLLGTCSRNVCKYDEGVQAVTLLVKITKIDGKILQAEVSRDF